MAHAAIGLILLIAACGGGPAETQVEDSTMQLRSPAFEPGGRIPARYTCDGEDVSPPLEWSEAPEGTGAFALIVEDPDARGFVHWLLSDIPADVTELPEGEGDTIGTPGVNDFGRIGWGGPCPPRGEHRYVFTLYALAEPLGLASGTSADAFRSALDEVVLDDTTLIGVYARGG